MATPDTGWGTRILAVLLGGLRGVFIVLALYLALGWVTMFLYDGSVFPLTYRVRIHLLSAHLFLAAGLSCTAVVLGLARDWLAARYGGPRASPQTLVRWFGRSVWTGALLVCGGLCGLAAWVLRETPMRMTDGLPSMRPSSEFLFDILS